MQIPAIPDLLTSTISERGTAPAEISIESELKLRSLYEYLDFCRGTLSEIKGDIILHESGSDGSVYLYRASERLERFCVEADSWGFNAMYEIALGLQMLLMNGGGRVPTSGFREALQRGLSMLSALLEQCERDFRWRLAAADTLDAIHQASGS